MLVTEELEHLTVLAHMVPMEMEHQGRIENCKDYCWMLLQEFESGASLRLSR